MECSGKIVFTEKLLEQLAQTVVEVIMLTSILDNNGTKLKL